MLYVLDWCVVCTGLVCCMYWTGVLYVLDWCVVCNSHTCFIYSLWLASELGVGRWGVEVGARSHLKL